MLLSSLRIKARGKNALKSTFVALKSKKESVSKARGSLWGSRDLDF